MAKTFATLANQYIGNSKYVWGGGRTASDIAAGKFDCSSFTNHMYKQLFGVDIGSTTREQRNAGSKVPLSDLREGDLVFFDTTDQKDSHVGIYMGNGKFLGAQSSTGVAIADMNNQYWQSKFKGHVRRVN